MATSRDNDDIAKLFRENDDIGAPSSLWLRPIRQFLESGKPIGQLTMLMVRGQNNVRCPFGVLTHTTNQRVVFWPVLPRDADMILAKGKNPAIDHITLELTNRKTHLTAYDAHGKASHSKASDLGHSAAWRLQQLEGNGLAIWFTILVRWSVLAEQEQAVQRCVQAPTPAETKRRTELFAKIAKQATVVEVPRPKSPAKPDFVYCEVYFVTDADGDVTLPDNLICSGFADTEVEGWPYGSHFEIQRMLLQVGHKHFVIATSCPPGKARSDVAIGLPRREAGGAI